MLKEKCVPATPDQIRYILDHLWHQGEEELRMLGLTKNEALARYVEYKKRGLNGTFLVDNVPIITSGIETENGVSYTWFIATPDFGKYSLEITRILQRKVKEYKGPLFILSVYNNPDAARWFGMLGFAMEGKVGDTKAGFPLYRYKRR